MMQRKLEIRMSIRITWLEFILENSHSEQTKRKRIPSKKISRYTEKTDVWSNETDQSNLIKLRITQTHGEDRIHQRKVTIKRSTKWLIQKTQAKSAQDQRLQEYGDIRPIINLNLSQQFTTIFEMWTRNLILFTNN